MGAGPVRVVVGSLGFSHRGVLERVHVMREWTLSPLHGELASQDGEPESTPVSTSKQFLPVWSDKENP